MGCIFRTLRNREEKHHQNDRPKQTTPTYSPPNADSVHTALGWATRFTVWTTQHDRHPTLPTTPGPTPAEVSVQSCGHCGRENPSLRAGPPSPSSLGPAPWSSPQKTGHREAKRGKEYMRKGRNQKNQHVKSTNLSFGGLQAVQTTTRSENPPAIFPACLLLFGQPSSHLWCLPHQPGPRSSGKLELLVRSFAVRVLELRDRRLPPAKRSEEFGRFRRFRRGRSRGRGSGRPGEDHEIL